MTAYEIITLIVQFVSALFVMVGLVYAGKQIALLKRVHAENHEWNRRIETQKALNDYNVTDIASDLNEAFNHVNAKHPIPLNEILIKFESNPRLQLQCHKLLNAYEGFARGI